ncbi:hypothetical protein H5410_017417, partial [Solanum commersonii]
METHEKITEKRIEKIEKELEKVRKENKKMEYTNQMYGLLNGEEMPNSRHPEDLNDLCYVINKNLKLINDGIKAKTHEEGSISNAPQPTAGPMDSVGPTSRGQGLLLISFLINSNIDGSSDGSINGSFKRSCSNTSIHVPFEDSSSNGSTYVSFTGSFLLSSQRYPEMAYPILPTTMAYPMPSPMITPPMSNLVFPPIEPQIDSLMNIPSMSASMPMDNNVDGSLGIPQSPSFSELLSLNDDEIMTLLDDTSFDIN